MKKLSTILVTIFVLMVGACKDKMVCPAYQSTYILDEQKQASKFSFFEGDSLILEASNNTARLNKNIYGLREREFGYWQQQRLLVVDQKDIYSDEIDSLLALNEAGGMAEFEADSFQVGEDTIRLTVSDGDAWSNTARFHYNVDFVNYMLLVGNDVLKAQAIARDSALAKENGEQPQLNDSTANGSKGGFFKKLFSGGEKEEKQKKKKSRKDKNQEDQPAAEEKKEVIEDMN